MSSDELRFPVVTMADRRVQFHRGEYTVKQVKEYLRDQGLLVRQFEEII